MRAQYRGFVTYSRIHTLVSQLCVSHSCMCCTTNTAVVLVVKGVWFQIEYVSRCQKRARALRDLLARYRNPHLQRLTF
jgi:hypothetical protein